MENGFFGRAVKETLACALCATAFCLTLEALFAVFVRAFALSSGAITAFNWLIQAAASFTCALLFIKSERTLFKGMAGGVLSVLLPMLVFGWIGGFHLNGFFLLKLLLGGVLGGLGALLGVKVRKE